MDLQTLKSGFLFKVKALPLGFTRLVRALAFGIVFGFGHFSFALPISTLRRQGPANCSIYSLAFMLESRYEFRTGKVAAIQAEGRIARLIVKKRIKKFLANPQAFLVNSKDPDLLDWAKRESFDLDLPVDIYHMFSPAPFWEEVVEVLTKYVIAVRPGPVPIDKDWGWPRLVPKNLLYASNSSPHDFLGQLQRAKNRKELERIISEELDQRELKDYPVGPYTTANLFKIEIDELRQGNWILVSRIPKGPRRLSKKNLDELGVLLGIRYVEERTLYDMARESLKQNWAVPMALERTGGNHAVTLVGESDGRFLVADSLLDIESIPSSPSTDSGRPWGSGISYIFVKESFFDKIVSGEN
jgi:hypothetical protein